MAAGVEMFHSSLKETQETDPDGVDQVINVLKAGGLARLSVTVGLAGAGWVHCEVIEPNGTAHTVGTLELRRRATHG